jgi:NAD(P)-dependent dehydrogenase (short-subunit alcohol dehydrogenase family)
MITNKVALITGISSGIGREAAQLLAERGGRVFGTVRDLSRARGIAHVELIPMDVTDDQSVTDGVKSVLETAGQLDFLVNNAGYALGGALEEASIQEAQQQFDTNFFGALRVIQAALPAMRKQGDGRIVNISSMLGILPAPYRGIYAASKHALEGYTETLDHEVRTLGIRALLVEPGFTKTRIEHGDEPSAVAEVIYRALTDESPRMRYPVGKGVRLSRLRRFVPTRMFERRFRAQFRLDEPVPERDPRRPGATAHENKAKLRLQSDL